jgi:hypothetical protein
MDTVRHGMGGAVPRFAVRTGDLGGLMHKASEIDTPNHPDARLMTAAPALLDALQALLAISESDEWNGSGLLDDALADARAAVAEATGSGVAHG